MVSDRGGRERVDRFSLAAFGARLIAAAECESEVGECAIEEEEQLLPPALLPHRAVSEMSVHQRTKPKSAGAEPNRELDLN